MKKKYLALGRINEFGKFIREGSVMTKCMACNKKTTNCTSRRIGKYKICDGCWEIGYRFKNVFTEKKGEIISTSSIVLYRKLNATSIIIKKLAGVTR